jgi:hypothetical protein
VIFTVIPGLRIEHNKRLIFIMSILLRKPGNLTFSDTAREKLKFTCWLAIPFYVPLFTQKELIRRRLCLHSRLAVVVVVGFIRVSEAVDNYWFPKTLLIEYQPRSVTVQGPR